MNYQNVLCIGDGQTFGARTYGCYPLYLARLLTASTRYQWRCINCSVNGYTARDVWFMLDAEVDSIRDTYQACLLIGTNDVGENKSLDLFEEYYRQILRTFMIKRYRTVFCATVPPIYADGHAFFTRPTVERRERFNQTIARLVDEVPKAYLVSLDGLGPECYEDPVHFNEQGNLAVAQAFGEAMRNV